MNQNEHYDETKQNKQVMWVTGKLRSGDHAKIVVATFTTEDAK